MSARASQTGAGDSESILCHLQGEATKLVRFVADPPTITMQRLRGILTVPCPSLRDCTLASRACSSSEALAWSLTVRAGLDSLLPTVLKAARMPVVCPRGDVASLQRATARCALP